MRFPAEKTSLKSVWSLHVFPLKRVEISFPSGCGVVPLLDAIPWVKPDGGLSNVSAAFRLLMRTSF